MNVPWKTLLEARHAGRHGCVRISHILGRTVMKSVPDVLRAVQNPDQFGAREEMNIPRVAETHAPTHVSDLFAQGRDLASIRNRFADALRARIVRVTGIPL